MRTIWKKHVYYMKIACMLFGNSMAANLRLTIVDLFIVEKKEKITLIAIFFSLVRTIVLFQLLYQ